jgi:phosphomannomutase
MKVETFDAYVKAKKIKLFDAKADYIADLKKKIDFEAIRKSGLKFVYDPMHGAGIDFMHRLFDGVYEIHGEYNPSFGEVDHPEPIAECLEPLSKAVRKKKADMGLATDGDADRVGAVDHTGAFVDPHRIFMLLMKYLYEYKKRRGAVVKTVSLTSMVSAYCEKHKIKVHETPVGFKYVAKLMNEEKILIGGEESGGLGTSLHIPERDGIFNGLLLLEMMAVTKKSLKQLCDELDEEFGPHRYRRRDVHVTNEVKKAILAACAKKPTTIGTYPVERIDTRDGFKFYVKDGWLLIRASGTEPLVRFYAEAPSLEMVNALLDAGLRLS